MFTIIRPIIRTIIRRRTIIRDYAFLLYALYVLAEQDCCPCKDVLRTVFLCTRILGVTPSLCIIREASIAVESAQMVTIIRDYVTIIAIIFSIIRIMPQPKVAFWVGIHCRLQANRLRNDWLVSMKNACTSASIGRRADRGESCLMERSGTIIRIMFSIIHIMCLG